MAGVSFLLPGRGGGLNRKIVVYNVQNRFVLENNGNLDPAVGTSSGGTAVAAEYGMLNNAVATISTTGLVTAVAAGQTQLIVTANNVTHYIPVIVEA